MRRGPGGPWRLQARQGCTVPLRGDPQPGWRAATRRLEARVRAQPPPPTPWPRRAPSTAPARVARLRGAGTLRAAAGARRSDAARPRPRPRDSYAVGPPPGGGACAGAPRCSRPGADGPPRRGSHRARVRLAVGCAVPPRAVGWASGRAPRAHAAQRRSRPRRLLQSGRELRRSEAQQPGHPPTLERWDWRHLREGGRGRKSGALKGLS